MGKYSGPEDIYKELVENSPDDKEPLLGLVAFAVVEEQKIEWMKHQQETNEQPPSTEDIENWYKQQPPGVLDRAKETAETKLREYGSNEVDRYREQYQEEFEEGLVAGEIRSIKKSQFGVSLAGGFVSALIFAALLALVAFFVFNDSSPVDIGAKLGHKTEVNK
jgi:hypothetical protein